MRRLRFFCALAAAGWLSTATAQETKTEKTFDNWVVTCGETAEGKNCAMSQTLRDAKTKQVVLTVILARTQDGKNIVTVRTPIGVLLPAGLGLAIEGGPETTAQYRFCGPRACHAQFEVAAGVLDAFRKQAAFTATFSRLDGQRMSVAGSLKGFSGAFDFLVEQG
jgi:invasion protein IalB